MGAMDDPTSRQPTPSGSFEPGVPASTNPETPPGFVPTTDAPGATPPPSRHRRHRRNQPRRPRANGAAGHGRATALELGRATSTHERGPLGRHLLRVAAARARPVVLRREDARIRHAGHQLEPVLAGDPHRHRCRDPVQRGPARATLTGRPMVDTDRAPGTDPETAAAWTPGDGSPADRLWLADWRRHVAALYAEVRAMAATDPEAAHAHWRSARETPLPDASRSRRSRPRIAPRSRLATSPFDPAMRFVVVMEPAPPPAPGAFALELPNSGKDTLSFSRVGTVTLPLPGEPRRLSVFWMAGTPAACSSRSATPPTAARPTARAAISSMPPRATTWAATPRRARSSWTSISRRNRHARSIHAGPARSPRPRTASIWRSARASAWRDGPRTGLGACGRYRRRARPVRHPGGRPCRRPHPDRGMARGVPRARPGRDPRRVRARTTDLAMGRPHQAGAARRHAGVGHRR